MMIQSLGRGSRSRVDAAGDFLSRPRKPRTLYLTAFFLPFLLMAVMWAVSGVIPFGSKMILAHDQWHQYYPFFLDLRSRLQNGQSLFHSWTTGMGTNYLSLFAYYLASPLNLPAVILPESLLLPYYTLTVLVRLGLAGLFCAVFLRKVFGREELVVVFFSTAYAFCAFFMGYYWNAIWLDTVALLPLVTLGTFSLLKERRCVLYVASLALSVYCSYYIGLFICVFVLLLFIGWHVVRWDDLAGFWTRFWRIALCSLIAIGMTAALTIPAYIGLQSTSSAVNNFPEDNAMNIVRIPALAKSAGMELVNRGELHKLFTFFGTEAPSFVEDTTFTPGWIGLHASLLTLRYGYIGSFLAGFRIPLVGLRDVISNTGTLTEPTTMEGLPNIFCGFFTLILATAYLFCKRIPRRERIFTVLLLLFFANSFLFRTLDYVWHGMHFPNMLPYRFSFLWSFTVIFMAFRAYTQIEHLSRWRATGLIVAVTILVCCVVAGGKPLAYLATTAVGLIAMGLLLFYVFRVIHKQALVLGLCIVMLAESLGCAILGISKIGFTDSAYYPSKKDDTRAAIEAMQEREADNVDLWRAEVAMKQTLNDGTLLGYNGISVFSSAANSRVSAFLQSIGLAASVAGNRYVYQEADPFTNLLLGLKYVIDRTDRKVDNPYLHEVAWEGDVTLLENLSHLSLGFMVGDKALEYDASQNAGLPFDRLNRLFREMTGIETELYSQIPSYDVKAVGNAELSARTSTSFRVKGDCDDSNYVEASIEIPEDGMLCIYSKSSNMSDLICYLDGERQYTWSDSYGYNRCMGVFSKGDVVSLRFRAKQDKDGSVTLGAAMFRSEVFDEAYKALSDSSMVPLLVSDTRIEGAVRVRKAGLLYLSIPNDNGWTLTVDGEPARITPVGSAMIAAHLEPGMHAIVLRYETPGFSLGLKISVVCLATFLALVILSLLLRFSQPPIVKVPVSLSDPRQDGHTPPPDAPPSAEPIPAPDASRTTRRTPVSDALLTADAMFASEPSDEDEDADVTVYSGRHVGPDAPTAPEAGEELTEADMPTEAEAFEITAEAGASEPSAQTDGMPAEVADLAETAAADDPPRGDEAGKGCFEDMPFLEELDRLLEEKLTDWKKESE